MKLLFTETVIGNEGQDDEYTVARGEAINFKDAAREQHWVRRGKAIPFTKEAAATLDAQIDAELADAEPTAEVETDTDGVADKTDTKPEEANAEQDAPAASKESES